MNEEELEELMFKNPEYIMTFNSKDVELVIRGLQYDRKQWINQYTKAHNDYVILQQENHQLKDRIEKAIEIAKSNHGSCMYCEWVEEILKGEENNNLQN